MPKKKYWLMKSEPDAYSIEQLKKDRTTRWDGVRNYQARNFMIKDMKVGDEVLFYHSNTKPPGVVGLAVVSQPAAPDKTALDPKSDYFDPKSTKENPRWFCVEVEYKKTFPNKVPLEVIKDTKALDQMLLIKKGMRLSIQPVTAAEFKTICKLAETQR